MVHSGCSSPMNTTSALPLPSSATAPPPVPPPTVDTEHTHIKPASILDPVPANAESPVSNESKSVTSSITQSPAQPVFNGRTSGRKRTPKSCDCCGPNSRGHNVQNSRGHNVQTPNRGRGRARGRPRIRGTGDNLENTPKGKVGGLLAQSKTFELPKPNLTEVEGTRMGADSPSQNSIQMHIPEKDKVTINCVPSAAKESQRERLIEKESINNSDTEMKVLDKTVAVSPCSPVIGTPLSTTGENKRKLEDSIFNSSTNVPVPSIANKQAKLEREIAPVPKSPSQSVKPPSNGLQSSNKDEIKSQVRNGPLQSGTKPGDTSAVELILIDQASDKTNSVPLTLSNGNFDTPTDDTQEVTLVDSGTSRPAPVPPPSHGPIAVISEQHPWALRDHWTYCRSGTWDKVDQTQDTGAERLNDKSQGQEEAEGESERPLDMIHEFLESFYVKYGSFIPLTEADVVEHLKKKSTSDFTNTGLDIEKEVKQYIAGLASAPVAGFMVTHNKHTLSLEDLSTLEEQNWINDQIINMYGELIMEATEQRVHFFNSFFHKQLVAKGYEGVKRWTKKIDLFSKWLVLIPIHLEIHWSLVTVSMAHKTISYYDSQGIVFRHTTENIMKYLLAEAKEKKQTAFQKGWKITIIKGIPQQKNDSDCGVFVLEYCRCLSVKQPFRFSQEDMPRIRKRIYKELCDCRLDV